MDYCSLGPLGSYGHEDDRSCVVNQELVISLLVPTEHAHTFGECSNKQSCINAPALYDKDIDKHDESGPNTGAHPTIAPSRWEKKQKGMSVLSFHRQVTYSYIGLLVLSQSLIQKRVRQQAS